MTENNPDWAGPIYQNGYIEPEVKPESEPESDIAPEPVDITCFGSFQLPPYKKGNHE